MDYHFAMPRAALPVPFDAAEAQRFEARFAASIASLSPSEAEPLALQWVSSPVGPLLVGASRDALVLLEFSDHDQLERFRKHFNRPLIQSASPILEAVRKQLDEYFAGTRRVFDLPLEVHGSPFQERVWAALQAISYGETCSYGAIAKSLGDANAMRAVGAANGLNPIAIVIPCHRVVNANGELGGYGGGLWRKRILLDLERGQGNLF